MSNPSPSYKVDRQGFVKIVLTFLGTIMGTVIGLPFIQYFLSPALKKQEVEDWISLGPLANYPLGTPTLVNFTRTQVNGWERTSQSYGVYVHRASESKVTAFSNICTHLSCRLSWEEDLQQYVCPCHDASFDINGQILNPPSPAPRPMDTYETKLEEGNLSIHFQEG
jgi:Rieske Fe-S protein